MAQIAPEIFKAYDIRSIVNKTLTKKTTYGHLLNGKVPYKIATLSLEKTL